MHGDTAVIDHGWLRTLDPAEIVAHLDAENAHTAHRTAHLAELRSALARELTAPEPPTELFVRSEERRVGKEGRSRWRRWDGKEKVEEVAATGRERGAEMMGRV